MRVLIALVALAALLFAGGAAQPVSHDPTGTIAGPFGETTLGGSVTFSTTTDNLKGYQYPMVIVDCTQDGVSVYRQLDHADATFVLGGGWSPWLDNGGDAVCTASLWAYAGLHKDDPVELDATGAWYA